MSCECAWGVDYSTGKLVFSGGYTLPNYAVRQVDIGFLALEVKALDIADAEHSTGFTGVPAAPEKSRTASLPLLVSFKCNPAGTPFADAGGNTANQIGWASNWSGLNALADASFTGDGTQTVTYTPYTGATPVALTLKVNPPTLTGGQRDGGVEATLDVVIYNVAVLA